LYAAGAREFLVLNVPNLGLTPAVRSSGSGAESAANSLAVSFNLGLNGTLSGLAATLPAIQIVPFDFYSEANTLVANPEAFGLSDVEDACVTPNMPPFACQMPDEFLFWDGIHPTAAVHAILAQQAATALAQYGDEVSMSGPALH
jgi:phospholipase/lecithinase/hemolysin